MCIIIDANIAHEVVHATGDAKPIIDCVMGGNLQIVAAHKLKDELLGCAFRPLYKQLLLAGRLREIPNESVEAEMKVVSTLDLKSNDHHIIALARASGARLLFSRDGDLHADFKNGGFVSRPRGSVYQNKNHKHLLAEEGVCSCS